MYVRNPIYIQTFLLLLLLRTTSLTFVTFTLTFLFPNAICITSPTFTSSDALGNPIINRHPSQHHMLHLQRYVSLIKRDTFKYLSSLIKILISALLFAQEPLIYFFTRTFLQGVKGTRLLSCTLSPVINFVITSNYFSLTVSF